MKQLIFIIAIVIIQAATQTIYVDYDTGKVLGVDEGKQVYPQQNYPQKNWQSHHHRHNQQQMTNNHHRKNQNTIPQNNIKAQWVCVNSVTGQSMIIDPENNGARSGTGNSQINNRPAQNPYQDNPWLNNQPMARPNDPPPQPTIPSRQNIQEPPIPVTTQPPPTQPTVPDIDWTKFLEPTTKKPAVSLETAIDGVGILQPRIFER